MRSSTTTVVPPAMTAVNSRRHGTPIAGLGQFGLTHVFPTPAALAAADFRDLPVDAACARAIRDCGQDPNRCGRSAS
ncbi:hypothetical protein AB0L57_16465 [Nocardia sp. NPDC052254]|uniref:hypothetical protein n=1 Tax=Nocardia sp. NPDC052254 TaxID=3155681 RepID=UPI00342A89E0